MAYSWADIAMKEFLRKHPDKKIDRESMNAFQKLKEKLNKNAGDSMAMMMSSGVMTPPSLWKDVSAGHKPDKDNTCVIVYTLRGFELAVWSKGYTSNIGHFVKEGLALPGVIYYMEIPVLPMKQSEKELVDNTKSFLKELRNSLDKIDSILRK